ncbi:hypothetical protein MKX01_019033 [Papaver californicum]|nr:hypothetical protein MKX01_019033 [Papaver californicum]
MAAIQMLTTGFFKSPSHFNRSIYRLVGPIKVHPFAKTNTTRLLDDDDDDMSYLLKLDAGSVGGAVVIKYGSVLLAMIFTPVLIAVLLLIKQSSSVTTERQI